MINNIINYLTCFGWLPIFLALLLGALIWAFLSKLFGKKHTGDLTAEGEGALRAESDGLRARIRELEGSLASAQQTATVAPAVAEPAASDDDTYALEWRNRYLAARVKYLEGRLTEGGAVAAAAVGGAALVAAKKKPAARKLKVNKAKKPVVKKRVAVKPAPKKKASPKKAKAKATPKPKVLYTDGPTDGAPDDLKLIKGIGPKFEKDLNGKGIYYFRQIGAWKKADVKMVEGVIDSIPGRIERDEWVKQAKGLAKGAAPRAMKGKPAAKGTKSEQRFAKYYPNVQKFDSKANKDVVKNIIKYCGPALNTRDASLVACSDEAEVQRVAKGFITKKLGLKSGQLELAQEVCQTMKPQRFKDRVTFYYLAAQKAGKLSVFK